MMLEAARAANREMPTVANCGASAFMALRSEPHRPRSRFRPSISAIAEMRIGTWTMIDTLSMASPRRSGWDRKS